MLLSRIGDVPFMPRTIDPPAKQTQFVERLPMIFPQLIEILSGPVQYLFQIGVPLTLFVVLLLLFVVLLLFGCLLIQHDEQRLLLCHQSMALSKVVGKEK